MGCMFRSEEMTYCEMYIQPEAAFEVLSKLGEKGCAEIEDMTPELKAFQRHYIAELCRCVDMELCLRFIETEMKKDNIEIPALKEDPGALHPNELNDTETILEKWESDISQMAAYQVKLRQNLLELREMYYTFKYLDPILGDVELRRESILQKSSGAGDPQVGRKLHVETGVVRRSKCYAFEIMLWRVSRGNIYFKTAEEDQLFEEPTSGQMIRKVAFVAICQGDELKTYLQKICAGFHAHMYQCPRTFKERVELIAKLESRITDLNQVIRKTNYHRCKQFRIIAKNLEHWIVRVKKSKAIFYNMNYFSMDITRKCLIGQCWMPTRDLKSVHHMFEAVSTSSGSNVQSFLTKIKCIETPPTYYRTNKFTRGFQNLIDAYGDSLYQELNPGLYTIITFPFLFAVMFGDCGHGLIMLSFALWMVLCEKKLQQQRSTNEIWNIFFGGRYIILLMSIFTMYTGFMYNDWFSKPLCLTKSYWVNHYTKEEIIGTDVLTFDPAMKTNDPYFFGVDPCWPLSENKIQSLNSLKMKMSIILGILHMLFGLMLSLVNHIHFKKYYAIILEFIPQVLFLCCLFLWLVFLIFFKWYSYGPKETDIKHQPGCAPFILILFIDMCLLQESKTEEESCEAYMFSGQKIIQRVLLFVALVNVPILLFGSPVYLYKANKKKLVKAQEDLDKYLAHRKDQNTEGMDKMEHCLREQVEHYSESFGDLMIHQGVHTIEYVLSTISHTASYLRLWALSLAHAELSEMLWDMILSKLSLRDFTIGVGAVKIFVIFSIWAGFSISILVVMEGLSAFLHTLRLHCWERERTSSDMVKKKHEYVIAHIPNAIRPCNTPLFPSVPVVLPRCTTGSTNDTPKYL